ncbi:MAG: hypothetical protein ACXACO_11700 [Promethearchaeota archaeon]|jgi:hypothetical protein
MKVLDKRKWLLKNEDMLLISPKEYSKRVFGKLVEEIKQNEKNIKNYNK